MEWAEAFENVNYVAVIVAALSTFVVGGVWYSTGVFGKHWMKEVGLKEKDMQKKEGMAQIFIGQLVLSLVAAYFLAAFLFLLNGDGWMDGAVLGAVISLAFNATAIGSHLMFERKSMMLFALNAGHNVVSLTVMGAVLGGFGF